MLLRLVAMLSFSAPVIAGLLTPAVFEPYIAQDGSRSWRIDMDVDDLQYLRKEDRDLPVAQRNEKLAASFLGKERFCKDGWEITGSHTEKKRLIIEGRCK